MSHYNIIGLLLGGTDWYFSNIGGYIYKVYGGYAYGYYNTYSLDYGR